MYYMKLFGKIHIFLFLFTCYAWCSTGVQLLCERHRTEWNWVEYRITLGADATCSTLLESLQFHTFLSGQDTVQSFATFFFMDDNDGIDALSMTLVSSVAMLSVNNDVQVEIIYKQHGEQWYGGIRLLSIKLRNTLNP